MLFARLACACIMTRCLRLAVSSIAAGVRARGAAQVLWEIVTQEQPHRGEITPVQCAPAVLWSISLHIWNVQLSTACVAANLHEHASLDAVGSLTATLLAYARLRCQPGCTSYVGASRLSSYKLPSFSIARCTGAHHGAELLHERRSQHIYTACEHMQLPMLAKG